MMTRGWIKSNFLFASSKLEAEALRGYNPSRLPFGKGVNGKRLGLYGVA